MPHVPTATTMPAAAEAVFVPLSYPPLCIPLGVLAIAGLLCHGGRLRGTTLVAPWVWAILAIFAIVAAELATELVPSLDRSPGLSATRYAAYAASLCPIVALLGAKRPQDRGWQLIVLSLWGIMLVPVFSSLFFSSGVLSVELIWSCFLAVLIAIGFFNTILTKYWLAGILVTAGQIFALGDVLPGLSSWFGAASMQQLSAGSQRSSITLALFVLAIWSVHLVSARSQSSQHIDPQLPTGSRRIAEMNQLWFDFRDAFGTIWALRIAERVNANAARYDWGIVLRWGGFEPQSLEAEENKSPDLSQLPAETIDALESSTRVLLRRFVSPEWIDARLKHSK